MTPVTITLTSCSLNTISGNAQENRIEMNVRNLSQSVNENVVQSFAFLSGLINHSFIKGTEEKHIWFPFSKRHLTVICPNCCAIKQMFVLLKLQPATESCAAAHGDVPWPLVFGWLWNNSHILKHALGPDKEIINQDTAGRKKVDWWISPVTKDLFVMHNAQCFLLTQNCRFLRFLSCNWLVKSFYVRYEYILLSLKETDIFHSLKAIWWHMH